MEKTPCGECMELKCLPGDPAGVRPGHGVTDCMDQVASVNPSFSEQPCAGTVVLMRHILAYFSCTVSEHL